MTARLEYFPWQWDVRNAVMYDGKKLVVLCCGARAGKDVVSRNVVIEMALREAQKRAREGCNLNPIVNIWVVAARRALYMDHKTAFMNIFPRAFRHFDKTTNTLHLPGGIEVKFKSTFEPHNLVAEGVDFLIYTECTRDPHGFLAWHESLRPRLVSPGRIGLAFLTGTPKTLPGQRGSWVKDLFDSIKQGKVDGIALNYPTSVNPLMRDKMAALEASMPRRIFMSEIMAQWSIGDDALFPESLLRESIIHKQEAKYTGVAITGCDLARFNNKTVVLTMALREDGIADVVDLYSMTNLDMASQIREITETYKRHLSHFYIDQTGIGIGYVEEIARAIPKSRVHGIVFTNESKKQMVSNLLNMLEKRMIKIRGDLIQDSVIEELISEMVAYEMEIDDSGVIRFYGENDDYVSAFMLAAFGVSSRMARVSSKIDKLNFWRFF